MNDLRNHPAPTSPPPSSLTSAITLEEIINRQPRVGELLRLAQVVGESQDEQALVCGNVLFDTFYRPLVEALVGHSRQPEQVVDYWLRVATNEGLTTPRSCVPLIRHARKAASIAKAEVSRPRWDPVLDSSCAYELVHRAVYRRMPDCRSCTCEGLRELTLVSLNFREDVRCLPES